MADVKKQLADRGLMPEDWGGQTVFVEVSAKKRTGIAADKQRQIALAIKRARYMALLPYLAA